MKTILLPATILALLLSCSPDNTRRGGDTGMADSAAGGLSTHDTMPSTGTDTSDVGGEREANPAAVLSQMNVANTTEIQLSTLAAKKAASPAVKQIAKQLATDHTKNREQVRALAKKLNVALTPGQGGSVSSGDSVAMPQDLQASSGTQFDKAFIQYQIDAHQSNIERIQNQTLPAVQDTTIKAYLQQTLTDMQGHLSRLQRVQQQLGS
jgi:putative membrane protein